MVDSNSMNTTSNTKASPPVPGSANTNPTPTIPATSAASSTAPPKTAASIPNLLLRNRIPKLEPRKRRQPPSSSATTTPSTAPGGPTVEPPPPTPILAPPPEISTITFTKPTRRILSKRDHQLFLQSPTYTLILAFIFSLSDSVADLKSSSLPLADSPANSPGGFSPAVHHLLDILSEVAELVKETPPDNQAGSRFGNPAFKAFLDKLSAKLPEWQTRLSVPGGEAAAIEVATYLGQSFGNRKRIDYGSGHELNFFMYLLCLHRLRVITTADFPALVLRVFAKYLEVMRSIQLTYYLEPAGSHGVWGLDDYQFLPFLFGASQLLHHPFITPKAIHQELSLEEFSKEFMYLDQVRFVNTTKTVKGLRWHSPLLDDISAAKGWGKVEGGMRKMFVGEVVGKVVVMQHFLFGGIIPGVEEMSVDSEWVGGPDGDEDACGHGHERADGDRGAEGGKEQKWGDCCGIPVPSSVGAAEEMRKRGGGWGLRRIPFD